jgi:hypothetical protein
LGGISVREARGREAILDNNNTNLCLDHIMQGVVQISSPQHQIMLQHSPPLPIASTTSASKLTQLPAAASTTTATVVADVIATTTATAAVVAVTTSTAW